MIVSIALYSVLATMLFFDMTVQQPSAVGSSVRLVVSCRDIAASLPFYRQLGFTVLAADSDTTPSFVRMTDGAVILTLLDASFRTPALAYFTTDLLATCARLRQNTVAVHLDTNEQGEPTQAYCSAPDGLVVWLHPASQTPLRPEGRPNPVCGTFGELAVGVDNLDESIAFWERLGYTVRHRSEAPYPWAIVGDGLMIIGLHKTTEITTPAITYFARDMADRIERLKNNGVRFVTEFPPGPDGRVTNAAVQAPDGQMFLLFGGDL